MAREAQVRNVADQVAQDAHRKFKRKLSRTRRKGDLSLSISDPSLREIPEELASFTNLRSINFESVKVVDFSIVGRLPGIENITFYNCAVKDLSWLKKCKKLRRLSFYRSRVGDLSPLAHATSLIRAFELSGGRASVPPDYYYYGTGLEVELPDGYPFDAIKALKQPFFTVELINYFRAEAGLKKVVPRSYTSPEGLFLEVKSADKSSDPLSVALRIPSALEFGMSPAGAIELVSSPANNPFFPNARDASAHRSRLEVCRALAGDIIDNLSERKFQARTEYLHHLKKISIAPSGGRGKGKYSACGRLGSPT